MENKLLLGKDIAAQIDQKTHDTILEYKKMGKRVPKLVNISMNQAAASASYVKGVIKKCEKVGVDLELIQMDESVSEIELIRLIHKYNQMTSVDGILLQMPLPSHIKKEKIIKEIDPKKDVDGMHPYNVGNFYLGQKSFVPCTALSVMEFIKASHLDLKGKEVVVIGRSNVIGKPVAQLCLNEHASVTIVHSKSADIESITSRADVLIAAVGSARLVKRNWIKKNAVVIDVGVNMDDKGLCGDVDFENVIDWVSKITPVPGGVGVVTNSMLMQNLLIAYNSGGKSWNMI